jgi:acetyl esterase/lipase
MTTVLTIAYGPDPDQVGDLYLPPVEQAPVAVLLHGGYWRWFWQRDLMTRLAHRLHDEGWAVWNPEFRRMGHGGGVPTTLRDVAHALDMVDLLAARHDLDASDVTIVGHSAGGQFGGWLTPACRDTANPAWQIPPTVVVPTRIVALAPVMDLVACEERVLGNHAAAEFAGARLGEGTPLLRELSPRHQLPLGVPMLVVHGTADDRVPYDLSPDYVDAAVAAGDEVSLLTIDGGDHFVVIDPSHASWDDIITWMRASR